METTGELCHADGEHNVEHDIYVAPALGAIASSVNIVNNEVQAKESLTAGFTKLRRTESFLWKPDCSQVVSLLVTLASNCVLRRQRVVSALCPERPRERSGLHQIPRQ